MPNVSPVNAVQKHDVCGDTQLLSRHGNHWDMVLYCLFPKTWWVNISRKWKHNNIFCQCDWWHKGFVNSCCGPMEVFWRSHWGAVLNIAILKLQSITIHHSIDQGTEFIPTLSKYENFKFCSKKLAVPLVILSLCAAS